MLPNILAALSGALMVFAYAPFEIWIVAPIAMSVLFRQWYLHPDKAFKLGWLFGAGWFGTGISWVHVSIADFGGIPLLASIAMMALLCGYLALFPALALKLTTRFTQSSWWPLSLPLVWFITENIRSWLLTGFPWLSVGYTQLHGPLTGWLPIIGETGVSSLLVLLSACIGIWSVHKRWKPMSLVAITLFTSSFVLHTISWVDNEKSFTVSMVQGNIAQSIRWVPEQDRPTMDKYRKLTEPLWQSDIVIWPEAAIPKLEPLSQAFLFELDDTAAQTNTGLVTGIINYDFDRSEAFNNVIAVGKKKPEDQTGHYRYFHSNRYSKNHLLPIGEVVPFEDWLRPLAPIFDLPMSSFTRGDYVQSNLLVNGANILPAICFEIAFPRLVRANISANTDMVLTVSNDAWFGNSHGPAQHLQIAQMRALEFGLPVIRSTNTGITAFVDAQGHITSMLPQFETGTLTDTVHVGSGITPYRRFGDWPFWIITIVGLGAIYSKRKII
jgi:apolipoprotein N-acyltransferase